MNEFPWGVLFSGVAAVLAVAIPVVMSLTGDARVERTARLLKMAVETVPGSAAEKALREAFVLQTARKLGRLSVPGLTLFNALLYVGLVILWVHFTGVFVLETVAFWAWIANVVASTIILVVKQTKYDKIVTGLTNPPNES